MTWSLPQLKVAAERNEMIRTISTALSLAMALAGATAALEAQSFRGGNLVTIRNGEVHAGDLYTAAESVRVHGRLDGDVIAGSNRVLVDGRIDGDVFATGNAVDLRGPIGDSTRIAAQTLTVDTTIDGSLLAGVAELIVTDDARIAGGITAAAARVEIDGTVETGLRLAAGEIVIRGRVEGDANLIADSVDLEPGARITGDLQYQARTPLSPEAAALVDGEVRFEERVDDESEGGTPWGLVISVLQMLAALLTGIVVVALFRGVVQQLAGSAAGQTTLSALLGFAAFLLVPAAAGFAMLTLVGLPLGLATVLLFGVALYAAKLPVAAWIGGRLLSRVGRGGASPYAAMALGVPLLYLLFAIPYVGWLFWLGAAWLGLGAMVVTGRRHLEARAA